MSSPEVGQRVQKKKLCQIAIKVVKLLKYSTDRPMLESQPRTIISATTCQK